MKKITTQDYKQAQHTSEYRFMTQMKFEIIVSADGVDKNAAVSAARQISQNVINAINTDSDILETTDDVGNVIGYPVNFEPGEMHLIGADPSNPEPHSPYSE